MIKLFDYQKEARDFLLSHKYVLLGDEQGLGKSIEAISTFRELKGPLLIVCPSMLKFNWAREVEKLTDDWPDFKHDLQIHIGKSSKFKAGDVVHVISYEALKHFPKVIHPTAIVFDEAHYMKNLKAKRTIECHSIVSRTAPEYCYLLSGTPIKNNVTEFYSLLKLLSYCPTDTNGLKLTEKSQYAFNVKFSHPSTRNIYVNGRHIEINEYHGIRNVEKLKEYLKGKYLRRVASKVLELPEIVDKDVLLRERPSVLDKNLLKEFEDEDPIHISTLKAESALSKAPSTAGYCADIVEQGDAVVVFTDHVKAAEKISQLLLQKGIKNYCMTGETRASIRDEFILGFQHSIVKVLVLTIGVGSTGLTLTAARNLVFNDLPWVPADIDQARKRIHRVGQTGSCIVHYILSSPIDLYIKEKLLEKRKNLKEIL